MRGAIDLATHTSVGWRPAAASPRAGFWSRWFGGRKAAAARTPQAPPTPPGTGQAVGRLSRDLDRGRYQFRRLQGARVEGERLAALLGVQPWLDTAALEGRLKQHCRSPRILHLATHGFFLHEQPDAPKGGFGDLGLLTGWAGGPGRLAGPLPENGTAPRRADDHSRLVSVELGLGGLDSFV